MRVFAWNKNRFIDTIMTPLDSLEHHKQMLQTAAFSLLTLSLVK
jgi:penicillin-binding protein 1A